MSGGRRRRWPGPLARAATLLLLGATGCLWGTVGRVPATEELARLEPGRSGRAEVRRLLGEPNGSGTVRWSPSDPEREIWAYGHAEIRLRHRESWLLVFFEDDRYDGHLWWTQREPPAGRRR